MKAKLILLFSFMLGCLLPISAISKEKEYAPKPIKIGYYVFIKKGIDISEAKTESLDSVYLLIEEKYAGACFNIELELSESPCFQFLAFKKEIYVEKMRINKRGKYKRLKKSEL